MAEKKQEETFSVALTNSLNEVQSALPKDFNKDRFVQNAVALLNDNEQLQDFAKKYGVSQIKAGMMKSAYLGLDFMSKEAYLIPYGGKLDYMPSYTGQVKLSKKYSIRPIKDIYSKVVREGDDFEEKIVDGEPSIDFKAKPFNDGKVVGAFAVALFNDGGMKYEVMSLNELEKVHSCAKSKNSPAWTKFPEEMYKKSVLKRLCKNIEIDFDSPQQYEVYNEDMAIADVKEQVANDIEENANQVDIADVIDVEAKEVK